MFNSKIDLLNSITKVNYTRLNIDRTVIENKQRCLNHSFKTNMTLNFFFRN